MKESLFVNREDPRSEWEKPTVTTGYAQSILFTSFTPGTGGPIKKGGPQAALIQSARGSSLTSCYYLCAAD